uniref:Uncharacterized protein n=1 Tax=Cacopsylla melanoneura TaxID=428564 RepID=A0A8D8W582_9HEMI
MILSCNVLFEAFIKRCKLFFTYKLFKLFMFTRGVVVSASSFFVSCSWILRCPSVALPLSVTSFMSPVCSSCCSGLLVRCPTFAALFVSSSLFLLSPCPTFVPTNGLIGTLGLFRVPNDSHDGSTASVCVFFDSNDLGSCVEFKVSFDSRSW